MQINKIYGNMNFGLKNSRQSKYTRDPRSAKSPNVQLEKPFYSLTNQGNLPNELNRQLSPSTREYIKGILEDIKAGTNNPNIINIVPSDILGEKFNKGLQEYLKSKKN